MEKEVFEFENLVLGAFPVYTKEIEIAENEEIKRGDLLVRNTDGKFEKVKAESGEGEQKTGGISDADIIRIATENVEESSDSRISIGYVTGEFRKDKIGTPEGFEIDNYIDVLDKKLIFLK